MVQTLLSWRYILSHSKTWLAQKNIPVKLSVKSAWCHPSTSANTHANISQYTCQHHPIYMPTSSNTHANISQHTFQHQPIHIPTSASTHANINQYTCQHQPVHMPTVSGSGIAGCSFDHHKGFVECLSSIECLRVVYGRCLAAVFHWVTALYAFIDT